MIFFTWHIFAETVAEKCTKASFFGLKPWYFYLDDKKFDGPDTCNITGFRLFPPQSDVPLVLLAIVDDLLRIAALVAIGFIIVGAIRMTASQGDPENTAKAQNTIINALIGLAIAIVASAFVAFLGSRLGN